MTDHFAVVGSGVSGLVAAHVLAGSGHVTVFEADDRPGGHAHTHDVTLPGHGTLAVDSGFIVHNERTYPTLCRLFDELGTPTRSTDMSMSIVSERTGWQYAGGKGLRGVLADPRTASRPRFLGMLREIRRFHRAAKESLAADDEALRSFGDWLSDHDFSDGFLEHFARPLVAAVWSCSPDNATAYPARSLFTFLDHHGMLSVSGSPSWRTVTGGSRTYVDKLLDNPRITMRCASPVRAVVARDTATTVQTDDAKDDFTGVVLATHPRTALAMLKSPTARQSEVLGAMQYSANDVQLHTDSTVLPHARRARASWNYRLPPDPHDGVLVSYDLTRLMRLPTPGGRRMIVTLGGADRVDPSTVVASMTYEHPLYTADFIRAQARLPLIREERLAFAGAYHGWGFHEDGAISGLRAAEALGGRW